MVKVKCDESSDCCEEDCTCKMTHEKTDKCGHCKVDLSARCIETIIPTDTGHCGDPDCEMCV